MATKAYNDEHDGARRLTGQGWLAATDPEFAAVMLALVHWRRYDSGESIIHAGDRSGDMLALVMGSAALTSALGPADAPVSHIATPVYWFGFAPLITGHARIQSCTARSPVLVAHVRQSAMRQLLAEDPRYWQWIALLTHLNSELPINIATDLMIRSSSRRCAATLLRIAGCRFADAPAPVIAWANQEELGGMANMARSTLNIILSDLEADGLISRGYNQIVLHDTAALRAIADG